MEKTIKKITKSNEFIERLKISLLNFSLIMIYTIYKILVLIENHLNYLKDKTFVCFFKVHNIFFHNI